MIGVMENKKIAYKNAQRDISKRDPSMGVLFETLKDKMDLLLEGHESAQKRIDRLDGRMGRVEAKLDTLEVKVDILEERFEGMETKFDNLDGKFDDLSGRFDGMEVKFDALAEDVRKKGDKEEILALGNRVTKLEAI
jgi:predicted nuclease with TOPRIM domain